MLICLEWNWLTSGVCIKRIIVSNFTVMIGSVLKIAYYSSSKVLSL